MFYTELYFSLAETITQSGKLCHREFEGSAPVWKLSLAKSKLFRISMLNTRVKCLSMFSSPSIPLVGTHTGSYAPLCLNSITAPVIETPTSLGFPHQTRFYFLCPCYCYNKWKSPTFCIPIIHIEGNMFPPLSDTPILCILIQTPLYSLCLSPKLTSCFSRFLSFFFLTPGIYYHFTLRFTCIFMNSDFLNTKCHVCS